MFLKDILKVGTRNWFDKQLPLQKRSTWFCVSFWKRYGPHLQMQPNLCASSSCHLVEVPLGQQFQSQQHLLIFFWHSSFRRFARFRLGFGGFHTPSALSIYKCNVCIMTNVTCSAHVGICQHESSVLERTSKLLIRTSHWVQAMYSFISASFVELFQLQKRSKIISQQKSAVNACCADR